MSSWMSGLRWRRPGLNFPFSWLLCGMSFVFMFMVYVRRSTSLYSITVTGSWTLWLTYALEVW
jgi:hypothetical protein